jgi:hypothetical protein
MAQKQIRLAGRVFVPVGETTVEHDIEFLRLMKVAGLEDPTMREGENPDVYAWRIMQGLIEAKALLPLLACLIIPETNAVQPLGRVRRFLERVGLVRPEIRQTGWTHEIAAATRIFLGDLTEPSDKALVYNLVAELLFPFLRSGLSSWCSSPRSSGTVAGPLAESGGQSAAATLVPGVS